MKLIHLNATGIILGITGPTDPAPSGTVTKMLVPDGTKYRVGNSLYPQAELVPPTVDDPIADLVAELQGRMDATARGYGYDSLLHAITYRGDPNPKFAAEAEGFFQWRSAVWTTAYATLAEVQAGTREFPTLDEALALMPALNIISN